MRNASVTTIAPTGTISLISGCSSGIEPLFAIVFERHILDGKKLIEINPLFEKVAKERGFYSEKLMKKIARYGSVQKIKEVPKDLKKIFVTAHDISPDWHVKMQAGFQKYTDNAVSKTVNLSHNAPIKDVEKIYWLAYKLKCKGVTVYRYGSKPDQVLNLESAIKPKSKQKYVSAAPDYAGGCPTPFCPWS
jgi:ribonucleoside-diphosphate reductase alpha chain